MVSRRPGTLMKAIVKESPGPGLAIRDVPVPAVGPTDVLIRVKAAGICGTDAHIYEWDHWAQSRLKPPLIIGHEFAGEVVEIGREVRGIAPGQLVSAEGHLNCGHCTLCRNGDAHVCRDMKIIGVDVDGAFAEYVKMPASNIWPIAPEVGVDVGAIHDPLGNAFHTVLASPVAGLSVLVLGAGPIGLMAIAIARAAGAARVIASESNPFRRELAAKMGAHAVVEPGEGLTRAVAEATDGLGVDVVCEMSGHPEAIRSALRLVRNGGAVRLLGLPKDEVSLDLAKDVIFKGITIYGVLGRKMYGTWMQMSAFLKAGLIDVRPIITHRVPFERFEEGIAAITSGKAGKVILTMEPQ
jgi:threonine 3-dehydrogenase